MSTPLPKIKHFSVKTELRNAIKLDNGLKAVLDHCGLPAARKRPATIATLIHIIVSQQLSTQSASAIWNRLEDRCEGEVTAIEVLGLSETDLAGCGLSGAKRAYIFGLAQMVSRGELSLEQLPKLSNEDLIIKLTSIRGMGVWSAEIFGMFALGRRDFYPAGDLALQSAIQKYQKLDKRPGEKYSGEFSKRWSPHRTAVALLMWKYYGSTTLDGKTDSD